MVLIMAVFICPYLTKAQGCASTTGAVSASGFATTTYAGSSFNWSNAGNAQSSDDAYGSGGTTVGILSSAYSNYLTVQNFGFSIPTSATICEIHVEVERSASGLGVFGSKVADHSVRLLKNGAAFGADLASSAAWPGSDATATYGVGLLGSTWGTGWTPSDVNNPNFGMEISSQLDAGLVSLFMSAKIDRIRITVIYDPNSTLAVSLDNFDAVSAPNGDGYLLSWTAAGDEPHRFNVQRSANGRDWLNIATLGASDQKTVTGPSVTGAPPNEASFTGTSSNGGLYSWTDHTPLPGSNFYRLAMVAADGRSVYSPVREMKKVTGPVIRCWPNPFVDVIHVTGFTSGKKIVLKDIQGHVLYEKNITDGSGDQQVLAAGLTPGLYFLQVGNRTWKMLKQAH